MAFAVVSTLAGSLFNSRSDLSAARKDVAGALFRAEKAEAIARAQSSRGDSLDKLATEHAGRAAAAVGLARAASSRFTRVASAAPAECAGVVASAHDAIAGLESANAELSSSLAASVSASSAHKSAADSAVAALADLRGSASRLSASVARSEPSFLKRITPKAGVGAAAIIDAQGVPRVGVGITLGWSF